MSKRVLASLIGTAAFLAVALNACMPQRTVLEQVKAKGVLHVVTRNAPTTYYEGPHGATGLEYDLSQAFAEYLGVKLKVTTEDKLDSILSRVESGDYDLAAAGLTITEARKERVRFTPAYQHITQQLIYRSGTPRPRSIEDTHDGYLEIIANSSHAERLRELKQEYPELTWDENREDESTELLNLVAEKLIDYTIVDSNEAVLQRRFHPELRVAFDVSEPQGLAWAMHKGPDDSLYQEALKFFGAIQEDGKLEQLLTHHYGHVRNYNYAGTQTYLRHLRGRMPRYQSLFEKAATENDLDWRLLAAVAYQESHWNPRAVSPTGVRGIMMLTRTTAKQLGVKKRTDPSQSIDGGARYLRTLYGKFTDIAEPDRTWLTLAAYNVGYGHVQDARWITRQRGGDADKWVDVKESLPLLRKRKWYKKTRYGYARGMEPVRYVENIRSYYDILRWRVEIEQPDYTPENVLAFNTPAL